MSTKSKYDVQNDSEIGDFLTLESEHGTTRVFMPTAKGLISSQVIAVDAEVAMVSTVDENAKDFTKRKVRKVREARRLMGIVRKPSKQRLQQILARRLLPNCKVTEQDLRNAHTIFGPDVASLKGMTT